MYRDYPAKIAMKAVLPPYSASIPDYILVTVKIRIRQNFIITGINSTYPFHMYLF